MSRLGYIHIYLVMQLEPKMSEMEKLYITWDEFEAMTDIVAEKILADGKPDMLVGLVRGGLVPTVRLAHKLGVRMECIAWTLRDGELKEHSLTVEEALELGYKVAFIDDINDSGQTLAEVQAHYDYNGFFDTRYYTLISKTFSDFTVTGTAMNMDEDNDKWVVFPWEEEGTPVDVFH